MDFIRQHWLAVVSVVGIALALLLLLWAISKKNWSKIFVASIVCLGLIGGPVMAYFAPTIPTPIVAFYLAFGAAALVYQFLGGIPIDSKFVLGTVQVGGGIGALLYLFSALNGALTSDRHLLPADLVGRWHWQWAGGGWDGSLDFQMVNGALAVKGVMVDVKDPQHPILNFDDGTAELQGDGTLKLAVTVTDHRFNNAKYRWVTLKPLLLGHVYSGTLNIDPADPMYSLMAANNWGIEMTRPR